MQRICYYYICLLVFLGLAIRTIDSSFIRPYQVLVVLGFVLAFYCLFILNRAGSINSWQPPLAAIQKSSLKVWYFFFSIIVYGVALSIFSGSSGYREPILWALRLLPITLFPILAYAVQDEKEWKALLLLMVAAGTLSALIDILSLPFSFLSTIQSLDAMRIMSGEYASIDYFYAQLLIILLIFIYGLKVYEWLFLLLCLPLLLWRTFISISRGEIMISIIIICYSAVIFLFFIGKDKKSLWTRFFRSQVLGSLVLLVFLLWGAYSYFEVGPIVDKYIDAYRFRNAYLDVSAGNRIIEMKKSFQYGGLFGAGLAAEGDFTSVGSPVGHRTYIHNMFGFFIWKYGVLIGGGLMLTLLVYLYRNFVLNIRLHDRTGFVLSGIFLAWIIHSSVNMYYLYTNLNVWVAIWLGYFYQRGLRLQVRRTI